MTRFEESVLRIAAALSTSGEWTEDHIVKTSVKLADRLEVEFAKRDNEKLYGRPGVGRAIPVDGTVPALLRRQAE